MENVSRRSFVGMGAGLAAMAGMATAGIANAEFALTSGDTTQVGGTDHDMYRMNTSLDEINRIRRQQIDAAGDTTCEDGTVIPAIWHKCRVLLDSLGAGIGYPNTNVPENYDLYKWLCGNDEKVAEVYVNSPVGIRFTAYDASVATGFSLEECQEALDLLSFNGAMFRVTVGGITMYSHQRSYHGICESSMNLYMEDGFIPAYMAGTRGERLPYSTYRPMPLNKDITLDDQILPYDDVDALCDRHTIFAVSPCQCRYLNQAKTGEELPHILDRETLVDALCEDGTHLEKCFTFGEEAQYYIEQGIGREITREEMRELLKRSFDEGCVLQGCYTKYTEVICSCNGPCGILAGYRALEQGSQAYANISHYDLCYDKDACLKCGICVSRCPMPAIEMDADGYPAVTGSCVRCGQCAYVCPAEARKLTAKDEALIPEMPEDLLDWVNKDTMWRYEAGKWPTALL